ncbi:MAG: branched-chain amino acid ABC transporter permease [Actinobacteria bacterium]|nr:branched-chain amino acid ABC transporter permease [Actinomycetota bacterium]
MSEPERPAAPNASDAAGRPKIGVDEWVASAEERHERSRGLGGLVSRGWEGSPAEAKLIVFVALASTLPFWMNEGELFSYGLYTLLYALLALGLNIVVGFAGLLDLGYVAFYGFGAYGYALFSSNHYGLHWQAEASIPLIVLGTAAVGLILGLASRRLLGDYLAIVTLFFAQAFVAFVNNSNPKVAGEGLTGGPNGIPGVDPLNFFGFKLHSTKQYYFFLLIVFSLAAVGLYFLNNSRTGRAWRALREDPLAAEAMSIPVNRLKILAFMFGAGTAGLTGTIFAAIQTGVVAGNFDVALLITIYAIVILGGLGSIAGVLFGAIVINVSTQFLAPSNDHPELKRWLFYGAILLIAAKIRPWSRTAAVFVGTAAFGFVVHAIASGISSDWTNGTVVDAGSAASAIRNWVIVPSGHTGFQTWAYIVLVAAIVVTSQLKGWWRMAALIPTLYWVAVVWENVLVQQSAVTALILFGVLLIALMQARPQGLLGTARVEIV